MKSPRCLLFSRLNSPNSLSLSSQERCSSLLIIFVALLWIHPRKNRNQNYGSALKRKYNIVRFSE